MFERISARRAGARDRSPAAIAAAPAAVSPRARMHATFATACAGACSLGVLSADAALAAADGSPVQHILAAAPAGTVLGETVKPALRDPALYGKARCNDGTPFTFFVEKAYQAGSQSKNWVIYLEGGVFCDDDAFLCSERSPDLITTSPMADGSRFRWSRQGILSHDAAQNPDFYKSNRVFAEYCSSDYWAGAGASRRPSSGDPVNGWYFSGRANINAMLDILMSSYGLTDGSDTNVVWAGGSAGSFGAQLTANQASNHLPNTFAGGRLRLLKDSGWMPDWDDPNHRMGDSTQSDREMYRDAFAFWNATVDARCRSAVADPMDCVLSPLWYDNYKSQGWPIFIQSSATDSAYMTAHKFSDMSPTADVDAWIGAVQTSMTDVDWLFSSSDPTHTLVADNGGWSSGPTGNTLREMVGRFVGGGTSERVTFGDSWSAEPANWVAALVAPGDDEKPSQAVAGGLCAFPGITAKRSVAADRAAHTRYRGYCTGVDPESISD